VIGFSIEMIIFGDINSVCTKNPQDMKKKNTFGFFRGKKDPHFICLISLVLFVFLITSCKKDDDEETPSTFDPTTIEGSENLGSGYDVFENYADATKVKAAILDISKLNAAGLIETKTIENSSFSTYSGTSIEEYSTSLSVEASLEGSYMYFSGAVKFNFHEERYSYESYSFATVKSLIQKTQLRVPLDITAEDLKPYLTTTAKSKLNDPSVTPEYIFNTYGTHCITGVILGGRLDYSVSAKTSDVTGGKSIGVYAEASFSKGGVSISGSTGVVSDQEYAIFMQSCEKKLHVYGGQSEFGQDIINKDDYDAWINSIKDNTVFCNFTQHGLIPVWEFCDSQTRQDELKTAFETWATDRTITVNPAPRLCILDVLVLYGSSAANPYVAPNGRVYYRVDADLNANCGGNTAWIWLYCTTGYENDSTITPLAEICTLNTSHGESLSDLPGSGWVKLPQDLNYLAGGDYIYIAYRRRASSADNLLTGLRVELVNHGNAYSPYADGLTNWYGVMKGYYGPALQDLNEGAGGYTVYLYYSYDPITAR
jgi:hypothetical protein